MNHSFSCFIIGSESLLVQCAEALLQRGHDIKGIISAEKLIVDWANQQKIRVIDPTADLAVTLSVKPFDYFFSITNLSIIPNDVLALPRKLAINFHDGPLPKYAGLYATSWALMGQEAQHGITWHTMTAEVDKGEILKQRLFDIAEGETAFTLNVKCYEAGLETFPELVDELANDTVQHLSQNLAEQTYFGKHKRPPAAAVLNWNETAESLSALVRALNFGGYANPLTLPKLLLTTDLHRLTQISASIGENPSDPRLSAPYLFVQELEITDTPSIANPGTVTAVSEDALQIATGSHDVIIHQLMSLRGQSIPPGALGLSEGDELPTFSHDQAEALTALHNAIVRQEEFWVKRLDKLAAVELPYAQRSLVSGPSTTWKIAPMPIEGQTADSLTVSFAVYLARLSGQYAFDLGLSHTTLQEKIKGFESFFSPDIPLRVELNPYDSAVSALQTLQNQLTDLVQKRKTFALDTIWRYPQLDHLRKLNGKSPLPVVVAHTADFDRYQPLDGSELTLVIAADGSQCWWVYDTAVYTNEAIATMQRQFVIFLEGVATADRRPPPAVLYEIPILDAAELHKILSAWNATDVEYPADVCIHQLIEQQAEKRPNEVAIVFEDQKLTYHELNSRANQLARRLRHFHVGPDVPVGVYMERGLDIMVALIGIHKAGGAYLPLDPIYPADRIAFMVEDAQVPVIITQDHLVDLLPPHQAKVIRIDADWEMIAAFNHENPHNEVKPENLAYLIYTSGSTGKPKGVMVEHCNVINFFTGMDAVIPHDPPGAWLAVTSLSFDISVLELFWTLARGFKVVIYADKTRSGVDSAVPDSPHAGKPIEFSLFYFASDEGEVGVQDKYHLLLEGAKYGDKHGFSAVWTPERHFHAFGGLYPNPSVAGAAIATITERIQIRSGSCVLPLHHPIRVAEEWALVDNLSKGRVGISFAAGWQPNDFVLRPENYADAKNIMFRDIETVKKLWRGETLTFPGPKGEVKVRTLPRPIQPELPTWITAAGNPETFRAAGEGGFNILTHLLGQSVEELAQKIAVYREGWESKGHPGKGHVSLMLHTFVGDDDDEVREIVREPMKEYLRSAIGLVKAAAWHFPTFKQKADAAGKNPMEYFDSAELTPEDMDALLEFAFHRYYATSGLFGTPRTCLEIVNKLKGMGVDEIACLIDFGVPSALVLKHLDHLNRVKDLAIPQEITADFSIAAQIKRHHVTHFQCTPSMASMLLVDEANHAAFQQLQVMMVGGEAFPAALAGQLQSLVPGQIINMYGPTETTIWSATHLVGGESGSVVPIGRPIANTQLYVVDSYLQPQPVGVPGELLIGGVGVVRGYLNRPELTAERFIEDLFEGRRAKGEGRRAKSEERRAKGDGRWAMGEESNSLALRSSLLSLPSSLLSPHLYRTGDLARYRPDGTIDFLGRSDFQVKIRGYRVELGEIEALLNQHSAVREAVVVAREDVPGDKRLVAYLIPQARQKIPTTELRDYLKESLPEFMVPAHFVTLEAFPLTPNKKTDRKALPAPDQVQTASETTYVAPTNELEQTIATIWQELLNVPKVGLHDNFFDLGGHSLLTVQAHRRLKEVIQKEISITDMFRFPTIRALADYLSQDGGTNGTAQRVKQSTDRAEARRAMMMQRGQLRQKTR